MNLVDSSGWIEYFRDGANADFFAPPIEDADNLIVSSINIYEVFKKFLHEKDENDALKAVSAMRRARVIPVDDRIALEGARLSREMGLPMADCLILTTARLHGAILWTQDADFKSIEGVRYIRK
ncbi:MAG: type II toxin-antitoxin system VapC family toxin [Spirochaetes bacterium]|nr:type II toxin-antitoxin system VapC family toxin [Spirochaetota bacterium]